MPNTTSMILGNLCSTLPGELLMLEFVFREVGNHKKNKMKPLMSRRLKNSRREKIEKM